MTPSITGWHVLASSQDLPLRHVFHARMGPYNLALWRSDDGRVNAWENRCPHRSVPLTMGVNLGRELRCQYHGWRFATGSGQCTHVPAQPDRPVKACVNTFDCVEHDGWVWVGFQQPLPWAHAHPATQPPAVALRALVIHAPPALVASALAAHFQAPRVADALRRGQASQITWQGGQLHLYLQFQSDDSCVVHSKWRGETRLADTTALQLQQEFNRQLSALRVTLEAEQQACLQLALAEPVPLALNQSERRTQQQVRVAAKYQAGSDITALSLVSDEGVPLANFDAGAHIAVHTPAGVRHYSLVNAPGERQHYLIAIKNEATSPSGSRGGSRFLCETLQTGESLTIGLPLNHFPLERAEKVLLIAAGIGITPLLAMAQQLQQERRAFELHYFVRGQTHVAFKDRIEGLSPNVHVYAGLDVQATTLAVDRILKEPSHGQRVYVCGPGPLIELVQHTALAQGWLASQVHYEYFANTRAKVQPDDSAFEVTLARSGRTLSIPVGRSIAEVLRDHGLRINTACEQGACGSCETPVLSGTPDHRDVYLTAAERERNHCMMPCVSRAKTPIITLDL